MSNFPDFDDEWRNKSAALCAAESTLKSLADNLTGPSAAGIKNALNELVQKRTESQTLSENIISNYKRSRRENTELHAQPSANQKLQDEKDHAVKKAFEYRNQVKVLNTKVILLGGTFDDLKAETSKAI